MLAMIAKSEHLTLLAVILFKIQVGFTNPAAQKCSEPYSYCTSDHNALYIYIYIFCTVKPEVDPPSTRKAYIQDPLSVPCGIRFGRLTLYHTVSWQANSVSLLAYNSTQGHETVVDGMFSYEPNISTLHIQDFMGFTGREVSLKCIVTIRRAGRAPIVRSKRTIHINLYYGEWNRHNEITVEPLNSGHTCGPAFCPL